MIVIARSGERSERDVAIHIKARKMQANEKVNGIVLKAEPIGEYDKRLVILTGERGKISAFARGARRPHSCLLAAAHPFCLGTFTIYHARSSCYVSEAEISQFHAALRDDYEAAFYGLYFLELMDYYTHENNDERMMLNLLAQSLKALCHPAYDRRLVRSIFEIKALALNGEYPGLPTAKGRKAGMAASDGVGSDADDPATYDSTIHGWDETSVFSLDYIVSAPLEKLYNFSVADHIRAELAEIAAIFQRRFIDRELKSLAVLEGLTL